MNLQRATSTPLHNRRLTAVAALAAFSLTALPVSLAQTPSAPPAPGS